MENESLVTQIDSLDCLKGGWMKHLHASECFESVFDHLILQTEY